MGAINMDYKKFNETYYVRMDKGDEIIGSLFEICRKEKIASAVYTGIGGCSEAEIQTFDPETGTFETRTLAGMLELVSFTGNVISDDAGELCHHTHALFAFNEDGAHGTAGGHLKSVTVLYTAEIELKPVFGGVFRKQFDPETGTGFWSFDA